MQKRVPLVLVLFYVAGCSSPTRQGAGGPAHPAALPPVRVRQYLEAGANHDGGGFRMSTPLYYAEQADDCPSARWLLQHGADPYQMVGDTVQNHLVGDTSHVIDIAAADGHLAFVKLLLAYMPKFPHPQAKACLRRAKNVALAGSVSGGTLRQVRDLLEAGADVNNSEMGMGSPLMLAAERHSLLLMRYLLMEGAGVNARDTNGDTALIYGTRAGWDEDGPPDAGPTRLLLRHGVHVNIADKDGKTALMCAAQGSPDTVRLLLAHGARVSGQDDFRRTALLWAASVRDSRSVALLLEHGALVNTQDKEGATALMLASVLPDAPTSAALADRKAAIRGLLRRGANARLKDKWGQTAANYARMHDADFVTAS